MRRRQSPLVLREKSCSSSYSLSAAKRTHSSTLHAARGGRRAVKDAIHSKRRAHIITIAFISIEHVLTLYFLAEKTRVSSVCHPAYLVPPACMHCL